MTLAEKIGQMTQPDQEFIKDPADVEKYFLGSVLSGGGSDPKDGNSMQAWTSLYEGYQRHALNTRLRIPLLYGIDAVHGDNNLLGAVIFEETPGVFSDACNKAIEFGKPVLMKDDWKRVFEPAEIAASIHRIT